MKKLFNYLLNPFLPTGRRNFKNMATQGNHHLDALTANNSNPKVAALLASYGPKHSNYTKNYDAWNDTQGISMGGTVSFKAEFASARGNLRRWDRGILGVFNEKSDTYTTIFPKGRSYIMKGTEDQILSKLRALEIEVKKYPQLQTVADEISDYNSTLAGAYANKGVSHSQLPKSSAELDQAHDDLGLALYEDMHSLCVIFSKDPAIVENYYDMKLLRASSTAVNASNQTLTIRAGRKAVCKIKYEETDKFGLENLGKHPLFFYGSDDPKSETPSSLY